MRSSRTPARYSEVLGPMADLARAGKVLETEAAAILALVSRLDEKFERAVELIRCCRGRVILTGMGKSGIICHKIAATLASTGTTAVFRLLETIRRLGATLIVITGAPRSILAQAADVALDCSVTEEACPLNLIPTASTTAALALGDALAMTLLVEKGFREEDFANLHPGGKLGKRFLRVDSLMHAAAQCPIVAADTPMRDVIYEMSSKGLGMTSVVDGHQRLAGIITDGDLRRHMAKGPGIMELTASQAMTRDPVSIPPATLAVEALNIMERRKITAIVVVDGENRVAGVVHLHDLWRTEMF